MISSNVTLVFLVLLPFCEMYKILVISHVPIKTHAFLSHVLVKLLLKAGHQVTQIAIMPTNRTYPNLRQIDVSYNRNYFRDNDLKLYAEISKKIFTATMQHEEVQELLSDTKQQFDLVIAEWMFNDIAIGLAALYDCPFIWFCALESFWSILQQIEVVANRYTSNSVSKNSYSYSTANMMKEVYLNSLDKEAFKTIFEPFMALRGKSLPSYTEIMYLCSMVLVYSPVLMGDASIWPQNFKPIGGYHISQKVKQLPENLQSIMDNAKHGVIYFSLGSHLLSDHFPDELKDELLEMFSKLKQTIFWKHESAVSNLPSNVYVTKWFPQQSVLFQWIFRQKALASSEANNRHGILRVRMRLALGWFYFYYGGETQLFGDEVQKIIKSLIFKAHPNCALFITQGGILSMTEAVYYAVPIIGIPIFGDQFANVQRAVESGIAKKVLPSPVMANEIKNAIQEILHNTSYRKKVEEQSSIYHNRPMIPRVEVIYWVNHVIGKGVKKLEPEIAFFNVVEINIVVVVVTVAIALKYIFRRST